MLLRALLGLFLFFVPFSTSLRFGNTAVKNDQDVIVVGESTKLTCDYIRFRTESIRQITWKFEYNGVIGTFFDYNLATGAQTGSDYPFIVAENPDTATEKEVTVLIRDFRSPEIKISCQVQALRDNGYGKLRHSMKEGTSVFKVANTADWRLIITPHPEPQNRIAEPDKPLSFKCLSRGASPPPTLSFTIQNQNLSTHDRARVTEIYASADERLLEGRFDYLPAQLFERGGYLVVKCYAHYGETLIGKEEFEFSRRQREENVQIENEIPDYERKGKIRHVDADIVSDRFLDMMDPARHVHPGIPYDFFGGYLVMIGDNVFDDNETGYTTLLGDISAEENEGLTRNFYGRVNKQSDIRRVLKVEAIQILNFLGSMGYRVIGSTSSHHQLSNKILWTLEKRNFDLSQKTRN